MTIQRIHNVSFYLFLVVFIVFMVYLYNEAYVNWKYDLIFGFVFLVLLALRTVILKKHREEHRVNVIRIKYTRGMVEWTMIILMVIVVTIIICALWKRGYNSQYIAMIGIFIFSSLKAPVSSEYWIEKGQLFSAKQFSKPLDIQKITYLEINEKANLDVGYEGKTMELKEWDTDLLRMVRDALMEVNPQIKSSSEV